MKFGKILERSSTRKGGNFKLDNNPRASNAKAKIRQNVLSVIGAEQASVFDAFCGEGHLYRRVWHQASAYVGCDLKWYRDERLMFVADNSRVMRAINLRAFNIFDLDAYGSPWNHVLILCARREVSPGERFGLVLTDGSIMKIKMGSLPLSLANLAGIRAQVRGAARTHQFDQILAMAIRGICRRMNCRLTHRWEAIGKEGSGMRYIGLVLEGNRGSADTESQRETGFG